MSWSYLRVASRTVGLFPVNDQYLVRLELSNRTITPAGTGAGSTGGFPYTPPGPLHYAAGRIEYMSEGAGTSAGPSAITPGPPNTTTVVQGDASVTLVNGVTYNYRFEHTLDPADLDTGHDVGLHDGGTGVNPHISTSAGLTTTVYTGTFTTGTTYLNAGTHAVIASAAGASHIPKAAALDWWIDPDDWVLVVDDGGPAPGQWVLGEVASPEADNVTTTFSTRWPFADGSLQVRVSGFMQPPLSVDGASGSFTMRFAPTDGGEQPIVDYQRR